MMCKIKFVLANWLVIFLFFSTNCTAQVVQHFSVHFQEEDFRIETDNGISVIYYNLCNSIFEQDTLTPALPFVESRYEIQYNSIIANIRYEIISSHNIGKYSLNSNSLPVRTDGSKYSNVPVINYDTCKVYPCSNIYQPNTYQIGDRNYLSIFFCPFIYSSDTGELEFVDEVSIIIESIPQKSKSQASPMDNNVGPLKSISTTASFQSFPWDSPSDYNTDNNRVDYLIITTNALSSAFEGLRQWKQMRGLKTEIVTLESICTNLEQSNAEQIKSFLNTYVHEHRTTYALLGGDSNIIPTVRCTNMVSKDNSYEPHRIPCDYFYACHGGNWNYNNNKYYGESDDCVSFNPYVIVSRLPLRTTQQVQNYTDRLIEYERNGLQNTEFYQRSLFTGSKTSQYASNGLSDSYIKGMRLFNNCVKIDSCSTLCYYYDTGVNILGDSISFDLSNFNSVLSNGYNMAVVQCHGWSTSWLLDPCSSNTFYYSSTFAGNLQYSNIPLIVSKACFTNDFTDIECLSEAFIRNANTNTLWYLGNTDFGYENKKYRHLSFSDELDSLFLKYLIKEKMPIGNAYVAAKTDYMRHVNPNSYDEDRHIMFSANLIGDPSCFIYSEPPLRIENIEICGRSDTRLIINPKIGVCRLSIKTTNASGSSYYTIKEDSIFTINVSSRNNYTFCVYKKGYLPYIFTLDSIDNLYLQNRVFTSNSHIKANRVIIGSNVTDLTPNGDVSIMSGNQVEIKYNDSVTIANGFECVQGATFSVENDE